MKKLFYSFLLSFLIQQFVFSQQGWVNQNSGTNAELLSVFFLDHSNGLASGAIGTLIRTTDGGLNWTTQNSGTTAWLNSIFFLDQNYGWIVGPKWNGVSDIGHLLITTDGGINWTLSTTSMPLYEVIFNNQNIGNAIGNQYPGNIGKIAKTSDGGASWVQKASGPYSSHFWDMCFINDSTGWVVGATDLSSQGIILKTTDRGENWIDQPINTSVYFTSVKFVDSNIGWIVGAQGTIIKTTNNGADWIEQLSGTGENFYDAYFFDENSGWVVGGGGKIINTTDGGKTWVAQTSPTSKALFSISFLDENEGWIVGESGTILHTTNGGATFIENGEMETPEVFSLLQNYPNPFNPSTKISWQSPVSGWQTLKVYDVLGNEVATLVNEYRAAGLYEIEFNPSSINHHPSSGIYFYRLQAGDFSTGLGQVYVETKKMIYLK